MSKIIIIAAMAENRVIGRLGKIPWRLKTDMRRFKEITEGGNKHLNKVIMGRKTFESLPRPLGGRLNVVLTTREDYEVPEDVVVCHSLEEALAYKNGNFIPKDGTNFVIGGSGVYEKALRIAHIMYITLVHARLFGDVFFPEVDLAYWKKTNEEKFKADSRNEFDHTFLTYQRIDQEQEWQEDESL